MFRKGTVFVVAALALAVAGRAGADLKPEDVAACNDEAREAVRKGRDAPSTPATTATDEQRAAVQRGQDAPAAAARASDPQIEGIDAEGAKNPVYQAAYRSCMRKNGY